MTMELDLDFKVEQQSLDAAFGGDFVIENYDDTELRALIASKAARTHEHPLYARKVDIPVKVSAFVNDMGYLQKHQSLEEYVKRADLPTKVSAFINDSGYLTQHQSLEGYAKKTDLPTRLSEFVNDAGYIKTHQSLLAYAKKTDIPTVVSAFTNDAGYIKSSALTAYAKKTDIPAPYDDTAVRALISDRAMKEHTHSQYLTEHQSLEGYAKVEDIPTVPTNVSAFTNDAGYLTEAPAATYECTYGTTTASEVDAAIAAGKLPYVRYNGRLYLYSYKNSSYHFFTTILMSTSYYARLAISNSAWYTSTTDLATTSMIPDIESILWDIENDSY